MAEPATGAVEANIKQRKRGRPLLIADGYTEQPR